MRGLQPPSYSDLNFQKNLSALKRVNPLLAERLCLPVEDSHVQSRDGKILLQRHKSLLPLSFFDGVSAPKRLALAGKMPLLLFGLGTGDHLNFILAQTSKNRIFAWDRDPFLLRLILMGYDWSEPILQGRLQLYLGIDLLDLSPLSPSFQVIEHPVLAQIYETERSLLKQGPDEKRTLIADGGLFVQDVSQYFIKRGASCYTLNFQQLSLEEIEYTLKKFRPQLIFTINYIKGLPELAHKFAVDAAIWEVDPATDILPQLQHPCPRTYIFTYREAHVDAYRGAGFTNVYHLPLAANIKKRYHITTEMLNTEMCRTPLSFVGSSMLQQALKFQEQFLDLYVKFKSGQAGARAEAENILQKILHLQRQDYSKYILPDLLQQFLPGFLQFLQTEHRDLNPYMLIGEIAAAEKRITYLSQVAHFGLCIWGDPGWKVAENTGLKYMGYAGHLQQLNEIYSISRINLDVNRIYQMDIVPMRVFDILACEGFLLAEYSPELERLFKIGEELEYYTCVEELESKIQYYLQHPEAAQKIARRGRLAVRKRHTITQRLNHVLATIKDETPATL